MRLLLTFTILLTFWGGAAMAVEEIVYSVEKKDGDIEIRHYEETIVAEVTVEAERDQAASKAFRTLFNYIQGDNIARQDIPMTAPVSQELASQKIDMTTPVSQQQDGENSWTIAFYMPNDMDFNDAPIPKNEAVNMRNIPEQKKAAIRFSGFRSNENIDDHEEKLRQYLNNNDIAFKDEPLYAFYDGPWVPWFLRRNEVLFTLK